MELREGQDIFFSDFLQEHEEAINGKFSRIQQFYKNSTVFITGITGFFGQMLIEKLLRSTEIKKIYALVRSKHGKTPQQRLDEILESVLFTAVAKTRDDFRSIIEIIVGDCCLADFGVSEDDRNTLIREVNVVFHLAASPVTDLSLKPHILANIRGIKWMITLAKEMRRIQAFIYLSTAFGADNINRIDEKVSFGGKWDGEKLLRLISVLDDGDWQLLEKSIWAEYSCPQIFTKFAAEGLIRDSALEFPVGIFRPSLFVSSAFEPLVGWMTDATGVQKIADDVLAGRLRVFYGRKHVKAHVVPVDLAVNAALAFTWSIGHSWCNEPNQENIPQAMDPTVLHYTTGRVNPITWGYFLQLCLNFGLEFPKLADDSFPNITIQEKNITLKVLQIIYHKMPAIVYDILRYLTNQPLIWLNFYKNVELFSLNFSQFTTKQWTLQDKTVENLWNKLDDIDRRKFNFNLKSIDWHDFMKIYVRGIRIYHTKEDINTLGAAKRRMTWLRAIFYAGRFIQIALIILLIFFFLKYVI